MIYKVTAILTTLIAIASALITAPCEAADVVVIGDTRLKPVIEIISGLRKTLVASIKTFQPSEIKGRLKEIVEKEGARVVVPLGREEMDDALALPPSIPVIYGLVITPPSVTRHNTTGVYMATPVREYSDLIRKHLHSIRKVAVVGSKDQLAVLAREESPLVASYNVSNPFEFVRIVRQLDGADAILLLPVSSMLTTTAMEQAFLLSFRKNIPLLGISERHVKEGALLALVVDPVHVGRQIGEYASKALKLGSIGQIPPQPPRRFDLYLNAATARKMGIQLPDEISRMAKRVYP